MYTVFETVNIDLFVCIKNTNISHKNCIFLKYAKIFGVPAQIVYSPSFFVIKICKCLLAELIQNWYYKVAINLKKYSLISMKKKAKNSAAQISQKSQYYFFEFFLCFCAARCQPCKHSK